MNFTTRFSGMFNLRDKNVAIVGAGGLGSSAAVTLTKMGIPVKIFDFDEVEVENVGTQFYRRDLIGEPKVFAIADIAHAHSEDGLVKPYNMRVTADTDPELLDCDILVSALDSLEVRQELWPVFNEALWDMYVDMRMAAEFLSFYMVTDNQSAEKYENLLMAQAPDDVPELACTEKATVYTANFSAGWLAVLIRRFYMDKKIPFTLQHDIMNVNIDVR